MNIASRGATMAVDWEQRIDFARLRTQRLEKARESLRDSSLVDHSLVRRGGRRAGGVHLKRTQTLLLRKELVNTRRPG